MLVIMVRYLDRVNRKMCAVMWDMKNVFSKGEIADGGAEKICQCVVASLTKYKKNFLYIVACCSDGCQTMVGNDTGLKARLKALIPHLIWVQCPAHKTQLCAKHAIIWLPIEPLDLIKKFHSTLRSANRAHDFENLQVFLGLLTHKIPRRIAVISFPPSTAQKGIWSNGMHCTFSLNA